MSLAHPASEESAFKDQRGLQRRGKRLLVAAGLVALAFFFTIIIVGNGSGREQSLALVIGDYIITLGIAVPGLTLYILRLYTDRSIRKGNPKVFSRKVKVALVSISWIALAIIVVLLIMQANV